MSGELELYGEGKLDRQARKEMERVRRAENVQRSRVDANEGLAAYEVSARIHNGKILVEQAQANLTTISRTSRAATQDNPALEMQHNAIANDYAMSAGFLIGGYMNRKRRYS